LSFGRWVKADFQQTAIPGIDILGNGKESDTKQPQPMSRVTREKKYIQSKILYLDLNDIPSKCHKENTDNTFWVNFQIELNGLRTWDMVASSNLTREW
jgi:hypothetical protein